MRLSTGKMAAHQPRQRCQITGLLRKPRFTRKLFVRARARVLQSYEDSRAARGRADLRRTHLYAAQLLGGLFYRALWLDKHRLSR
jgi:hypothetical protein